MYERWLCTIMISIRAEFMDKIWLITLLVYDIHTIHIMAVKLIDYQTNESYSLSKTDFRHNTNM